MTLNLVFRMQCSCVWFFLLCNNMLRFVWEYLNLNDDTFLFSRMVYHIISSVSIEMAHTLDLTTWCFLFWFTSDTLLSLQSDKWKFYLQLGIGLCHFLSLFGSIALSSLYILLFCWMLRLKLAISWEFSFSSGIV